MKYLILMALITTLAQAEYSVTTPNSSFGEQKYEGRGEVGRPGSLEYNDRLKVPQEERNHFLWGRCNYDSVATLEVPCNRGQVELMDGEGKTLSTVSITQGKFRFPIDKDKTYFVKIHAKGYESPQAKYGPFKPGDEVILKLAKKK